MAPISTASSIRDSANFEHSNDDASERERSVDSLDGIDKSINRQGSRNGLRTSGLFSPRQRHNSDAHKSSAFFVNSPRYKQTTNVSLGDTVGNHNDYQEFPGKLISDDILPSEENSPATTSSSATQSESRRSSGVQSKKLSIPVSDSEVARVANMVMHLKDSRNNDTQIIAKSKGSISNHGKEILVIDGKRYVISPLTRRRIIRTKAWFDLHAAFIIQCQRVPHSGSTSLAYHPGVDGVYNPLQSLRNREVRLKLNHKLEIPELSMIIPASTVCKQSPNARIAWEIDINELYADWAWRERNRPLMVDRNRNPLYPELRNVRIRTSGMNEQYDSDEFESSAEDDDEEGQEEDSLSQTSRRKHHLRDRFHSYRSKKGQSKDLKDIGNEFETSIITSSGGHRHRFSRPRRKKRFVGQQNEKDDDDLISNDRPITIDLSNPKDASDSDSTSSLSDPDIHVHHSGRQVGSLDVDAQDDRLLTVGNPTVITDTSSVSSNISPARSRRLSPLPSDEQNLTHIASNHSALLDVPIIAATGPSPGKDTKESRKQSDNSYLSRTSSYSELSSESAKSAKLKPQLPAQSISQESDKIIPPVCSSNKYINELMSELKSLETTYLVCGVRANMLSNSYTQRYRRLISENCPAESDIENDCFKALGDSFLVVADEINNSTIATRHKTLAMLSSRADNISSTLSTDIGNRFDFAISTADQLAADVSATLSLQARKISESLEALEKRGALFSRKERMKSALERVGYAMLEKFVTCMLWGVWGVVTVFRLVRCIVVSVYSVFKWFIWC
ncbi:hypothetical protein V1511DRAFT_132470 [Dipodascopsis uninucleata]